jgi:nicotinamide-nucleotide amidase
MTGASSPSSPSSQSGAAETAREVIAALGSRGRTVATAESMTGGLVIGALTAVPGASAVVRGGLVVYATDLKEALADVPASVLNRDGPVSASTASAMADGARTRCAATYGVGVTGVAGPDPQDGHRPGTLHVAVATPTTGRVVSLPPDDEPVRDRQTVREAAVVTALELLLAVIDDGDGHTRESIARSER